MNLDRTPRQLLAEDAYVWASGVTCMAFAAILFSGGAAIALTRPFIMIVHLFTLLRSDLDDR